MPKMMTAVFRYVCLCFFLLLCAYPAQAAEEVIFMSPTRVVLSDAKKVEVVVITNLASTERSYKVAMKDVVMLENGSTTEVDTFPYSAKRILRFVPRAFTIPPGGRQVVRVMARATPDLKNGDYHSHLEVVEDIFKRPELQPEALNGSGAGIFAPVEHSALIPIIYSHGKTSAKVTIANASITKTAEKNKYKVRVNLTREGNAQGVGNLAFSYIQPSAQKLALGNRSTVQIYREINKRPYEREVVLPDTAVAGSKINIALLSENSPLASVIQEINLTIP